MFRLELWCRHDLLAVLDVDDAGNTAVSGPQPDQLPTNLDVIVPRTRERVSFAADPVRWGRLLHTRLRTPYLRPVVVRDSAADQRRRDELIAGRGGRLSRAEAAEAAGVTPDTWSSYVSRGRAPAPVEHVSRAPRWRVEDVRDFVRSRQA